MLRYFCRSWFGGDPIPGGRVLQASLLVFVLGSTAISSKASPIASGQEPETSRAKIADQVEKDSGAEELLAAIKSLDETLNKKEDEVEQRRLRDRLVGIGLVGGAVLLLMGVLFAYLRLDHATRGFHSGRLQMLTALVAILIVGTCYLLWTQVLFK